MLAQNHSIHGLLEQIQSDQQAFQQLQDQVMLSVQDWSNEKASINEQINSYQTLLKGTLDEHIVRLEKRQDEALERIRRKENEAHKPEIQRSIIRLKQKVEELQTSLKNKPEKTIAILEEHPTLPEHWKKNRKNSKEWQDLKNSNNRQTEKYERLKKDLESYLKAMQKEMIWQNQKSKRISYVAIFLSIIAIFRSFL